MTCPTHKRVDDVLKCVACARDTLRRTEELEPRVADLEKALRDIANGDGADEQAHDWPEFYASVKRQAQRALDGETQTAKPIASREVVSEQRTPEAVTWKPGDHVIIARPKHEMWTGAHGVIERVDGRGLVEVRLEGDRFDHVLVLVEPGSLDPRPNEESPTEASVDGPTLKSHAYADTGDFTVWCSNCGQERDEPHTWRECAEYLASQIGMEFDQGWQAAEETRADREAALRPGPAVTSREAVSEERAVPKDVTQEFASIAGELVRALGTSVDPDVGDTFRAHLEDAYLQGRSHIASHEVVSEAGETWAKGFRAGEEQAAETLGESGFFDAARFLRERFAHERTLEVVSEPGASRGYVECGEAQPLPGPSCQREKGHEGDHQACDEDAFLSRWPRATTTGSTNR